MSTPRRRGAGSKAALRKRVGTPGKTGLEFEAAVQADSGGLAETFSYDDVSNLETVTPSVKRAKPGSASKAASRAARNGGGKAGQEKGVVSGRKRPQQQQQQQQQEGRTEKGEGGAAKRRKQRQQQQAAAAAEAAAAAAGGGGGAVAPTATVTTPTAEAVAAAAATAAEAEAEATKTAPPAGGGRERPEQVNTTTTATSVNNSSSKRGSRENGVAGGGGTSGKLIEADAAGRGGGKSMGEVLRSGDKRKRTLSPKGQGAAMAKEQGKAGGARRGEPARPARKASRYPKVALEISGKASNIAEALGEAVYVEVQGLIRQRGHEAACKAAVHACVDVAKEIRRQAVDIGIDLDPAPKLDLKELRRMFVEEKERQLTRIEEEESLWKAEEQKCLALAEKTRRAKEKTEVFDEERRDGGVRRLGNGELRSLMDPMGAGAVGGQEEEKGEELSEGGGTAKRVSDQLLVSTNDMLLNAGAIGRSLQQMGGVVADGQETKDRLIRVFRKHTLKNYPNVNDPKAGIAAMLK